VVQLLQVPDCPLVGVLWRTLDDCLRSAGLGGSVERLVGSYPSPTLLVNGIDVATGLPPSDEVCCRLDLPIREQIMDALRSGGAR
jgi:hypothetical protein